jgi:hypothetical protein
MPPRQLARPVCRFISRTPTKRSCRAESASSSGSRGKRGPVMLLPSLTCSSVWRPISPAPVEDCPLGLCDFRTVNREDLVPMDIVYPHFVDEAYEVKYNPSHRWFYKKGMTQEDVIVFKLYDSLRSEATGEPWPRGQSQRIITDMRSVSPLGICRPIGTIGRTEACQYRGQGHCPGLNHFPFQGVSWIGGLCQALSRLSLPHWAQAGLASSV